MCGSENQSAAKKALVSGQFTIPQYTLMLKTANASSPEPLRPFFGPYLVDPDTELPLYAAAAMSIDQAVPSTLAQTFLALGTRGADFSVLHIQGTV